MSGQPRKMESTLMRMPSDMLEAVRVEALRLDRSMAWVIRHAVEEYLRAVRS